MTRHPADSGFQVSRPLNLDVSLRLTSLSEVKAVGRPVTKHPADSGLQVSRPLNLDVSLRLTSLSEVKAVGRPVTKHPADSGLQVALRYSGTLDAIRTINPPETTSDTATCSGDSP